jgi:hypothetical protein
MTAAAAPRMVDVKVERDERLNAEMGPGSDFWYVHPIWADVDRPDTGGWAVKGERMARRLERAVRAGVAFGPGPVEVKTDVNGKTYVNAPHRVMSKYMNADLRRLGF